MTAPPRSGTQGYAEEAPALIARYEALPFDAVYGPLTRFFPASPSSVLDIGAGTGRDAAAFAAMGHEVAAAEPTAPLREAGMALHADAGVRWFDDALPELRIIRRLGECFDLVLMTAVFMHLDADERRQAMPGLAALLAPAGRLLVALRHGPVPEGRRMFEVSAQDMKSLAEGHGLQILFSEDAASIQPENAAAGVSWTRMAFQKRV